MGTLDNIEKKMLEKNFEQVRGDIISSRFLSEEKQAQLLDKLNRVQENLRSCTDIEEIGNAIDFLEFAKILSGQNLDIEAHAIEQEKLATTDALTGVHSKRFFDDIAQRTISRMTRQDIGSAAIIYVDVDKFKDFNTYYGHNGGDDALVFIADKLNHAVRDTDVVARLGGDEFAVLCVHKDPAHDFSVVRDHIHETFDGAHVNINGKDVPISVSAGIADIAKHDSLVAVKERADKDMYEQKNIRHRKLAERMGFDNSAPSSDIIPS